MGTFFQKKSTGFSAVGERYSSSRSSFFSRTTEVTASRAFTLVELLLVVAVIGLLSSIILATIDDVRDRAYNARTQAEFNSFRSALELYVQENGAYPDDVSRGIPPGIEEHLSSGSWPEAPWPGSEYDWENWTIDGERVLQLSVRFCEIGQPSTCSFPDEEWADDFDVNSAAYFCIEGPCTAHEAHPESPGYCFNCGDDE